MVVEFTDGFESGDINKWDEVIVSECQVTVETVSPKFGTRHLRSTSIAGTAQKRGCVAKFFADAQVKFCRGYFQLNPIPPTGQRPSLIGLYPAVGYPANFYVSVGLGEFGETTPPTLRCDYRDAGVTKSAVTGISLDPNKYYCLEVGVKVGAGTGEVHLWLDGQEVVTITGVNNAEWAGIGLARVGIIFADATLPATTVDVDEVAIGTSYIGPVVAPKPCWIATAAFLSPVAPQLNYLRHFRDQYLPDHVVETYYRTSPPIADYISKHERIRIAIREVINFGIKLLRALHVVH